MNTETNQQNSVCIDVINNAVKPVETLPPHEIIQAEEKMSLWFAQNNINQWALGKSQARVHRDTNSAQRLIDAIEGELNGLAISEETAKRILSYVLGE